MADRSKKRPKGKHQAKPEPTPQRMSKAEQPGPPALDPTLSPNAPEVPTPPTAALPLDEPTDGSTAEPKPELLEAVGATGSPSDGGPVVAAESGATVEPVAVTPTPNEPSSRPESARLATPRPGRGDVTGGRQGEPVAAARPSSGHGHGEEGNRRTLTLAFVALGVVFGDIGTSPLYALKECFTGEHAALPLTPSNVLGVLSLILWSLVLVVGVKYVAFVMRADNAGEGGILALLALLVPQRRSLMPKSTENRGRRRRALAVALGLFGAALLYGDGVITPAISVLSAIEGLNVATTVFEPFVVPLTVVILVALFAVQKRGTAKVGGVFGVVTFIWFIAIAGFGIAGIFRNPGVFAAINPLHGLHFLMTSGWIGFTVLGAVFLAVTGGEALYADLGHFGKDPIRLAWFSMVLPSLLLNYFGQGALLLSDPNPLTRANPFFMLLPGWALYPMVILATAATVVASQALISGAFSLTLQTMQLGYAPRFTVVHTSEEESGQIYIPAVNWAVMVGCLGLVIGFGSSTKLAAAYGIAVTLTMIFTTLLFGAVARYRWKWPLAGVALFVIFFLIIEGAFFSANVIKIAHGGWFPLTVGAILYMLMLTWKKGREIIGKQLSNAAFPLQMLLDDLDNRDVHRVPGTAVFMTFNNDTAPPVLLHHLRHNQVLHERIVLLSVELVKIPYVQKSKHVTWKAVGHGFYRLTAYYGYMQKPNVADIFQSCKAVGLDLSVQKTSFYLGRETLLVTSKPGMFRWQKQIFTFLSRNAQPAKGYFAIPSNRAVEIGAQIEI